MIPFRSRSDSLTFTLEQRAIGIETNFSRCPLVELATNHELGVAIGAADLADLNVHFQRILTFAEHATTRSRYDAELRSILTNYAVKVILPLKQARGELLSHRTIPILLVKQLFTPHSLGNRFRHPTKELINAFSTRLMLWELKLLPEKSQKPIPYQRRLRT